MLVSAKMLDVGFSNSVPVHRVIAIVAYESEPMKRHCQEIEKMHRVIDATKGRKVKSVVFLDSGNAILSATTRETLMERFENALSSVQNFTQSIKAADL